MSPLARGLFPRQGIKERRIPNQMLRLYNAPGSSLRSLREKTVNTWQTIEEERSIDGKFFWGSSMSYTLIQRPPMIVVGITCCTSNAADAAPRDIPALWARFQSEEIASRIPNKASNDVIGLYCDYEGDYTKPYSLVIGCPVKAWGSPPEEMVAKIVPSGHYALFSAIGEHPKALIDTWNTIWKTELKRTYTGDFERYGERFRPGPTQEVEVAIALEPADLMETRQRSAAANARLFASLRALQFPIGHYAITGSGPLGIRNLRQMNDLDIIVSRELWTLLAYQHGVVEEQGIKSIKLPGGVIEALPDDFLLPDRIAQAEIIDGLPFETLENTLKLKEHLAREKDLDDIFFLQMLIAGKTPS